MALQIIVAIIGLLAVGYFLFLRAGRIDAAEARRLVEGGAVLVDVRTPAEFADGHLPGAISVPVQDLDRRIEDLGPKDRPIVLYCRSGVRSGRAARILTDAGYASVHDLGPMGRW